MKITGDKNTLFGGQSHSSGAKLQGHTVFCPALTRKGGMVGREGGMVTAGWIPEINKQDVYWNV